jgi:hypothetical protein
VDGDTGQDSLVGEDLQQAADLPLPQPQVVPPPRIDIEDTSRVADPEHTDPLLYRPGHDLAGGFMLRLADPTPMPALHQPRTPAVSPPPP